VNYLPTFAWRASKCAEGFVLTIPVWARAVRTPFYGAEGAGEVRKRGKVWLGEGEAGTEVIVRPAAGNGSVQGVVGGVVDYTNQGFAVEGECEGDAEVGEAVDKVDGSEWGVSYM